MVDASSQSFPVNKWGHHDIAAIVKDHLRTLLFKHFSLFVYFQGNLVNKSFEIKTEFKTIFKGLKKKVLFKAYTSFIEKHLSSS